ncbi:MAG: hypothetical protein JXL97_09640 [Bacteroidales bacterium]|nr:hypothetical protein [Bacteroidales bacterium]
MIIKFKYQVLFFLSFILFVSCGNSNLPTNNVVLSKDSLVYSVSAVIDGECYNADYRSNSVLYITNSMNDTLIKKKEEGISPVQLVFEDFNNDGYLDIRYGYNSNYYFEMILLFIPETKEFKQIENNDDCDYAYSKNIKGTDFYYSFSPYLCGKNNWISKLYVIKDLKIKDKGLIHYKQCKDDDKGMYIYRLSDDNEILIKKFSLKEAVNYENYWIDNYEEFE